MGDGARTLFWENVWLGDRKLAEIFPRIYNITFTKLVTQISLRFWLGML